MALTAATPRSTTRRRPSPSPSDGRTLVRRITGDVRARILVSYVILLAIAALRLGARRPPGAAGAARRPRRGGPAQEVAGVPSAWPDGIDPETRKPFGDDVERDLRRLPRAQRARRRRGADHGPATRVRPRYDNSEQRRRASRFGDFIDALAARSTPGRARRDRDRRSGPPRYVAVPVEVEGRTLGTFVVADFTADEREEVDEAVRIVGAVAAARAAARLGGRLLRSPVGCWRRCATCATAPARSPAPHMGRRIAGRGRRRARRARPMPSTGCSTGWRSRSRASASSSATSATSCERRSRSRAGHLELLAEGHPSTDGATTRGDRAWSPASSTG